MKLKNTLIVVSDIEKSKSFYRELFGLYVKADFGGNVILTEGLVLQDKNLWESLTGSKVQSGGDNFELYFEENNMDLFLERLKNSSFEIEYVNELMERSFGQRVIRIYDPDRHIVEIGEAMDYVAQRFLKSGMTVEQTIEKTKLPYSLVEGIAKKYVK